MWFRVQNIAIFIGSELILQNFAEIRDISRQKTLDSANFRRNETHSEKIPYSAEYLKYHFVNTLIRPLSEDGGAR